MAQQQCCCDMCKIKLSLHLLFWDCKITLIEDGMFWTRSVSWLLMPWRLASLDHQLPMVLNSKQKAPYLWVRTKDFYSKCHSVQKWKNMQICFMFHENYSAHKELNLGSPLWPANLSNTCFWHVCVKVGIPFTLDWFEINKNALITEPNFITSSKTVCIIYMYW